LHLFRSERMLDILPRVLTWYFPLFGFVCEWNFKTHIDVSHSL
jgi:hypothetical protein